MSKSRSKVEPIIPDQIQDLRHVSETEVVNETSKLLQQRQHAEQARVLEGIRQGIEDMEAGRHRPADEVFEDIRREFNLPPNA